MDEREFLDRKNLTLFQQDSWSAALVNGTSFSYRISGRLRSEISAGTSSDFKPALEEAAFLRRLGYYPSDFPRFDNSLKGIALTLMYGCNMGCTYCCVGPKGSFNSSSVRKMDAATAIRSVDFLIENSVSNNLRIWFYGGEPLLNFPTIKSCVDYCVGSAEREWKFVIVTNGTLMKEEQLDFISRNNIRISVTLDGPPEIQNKQRPMADGKPSFALVRKTIDLLNKRSIPFYINCVYTKDHKMSYEELEEYLTEEAGEYGMVSVTNEIGFDIDERVRHEYYRREIERAEEGKKSFLSSGVITKSFPLESNIAQLLIGSKGVQNMCSSGWEMVEISPDGDIYLCLVSESRGIFKLGNINSGLTDDFYSTKEMCLTPYDFCRSCWTNELCYKRCHLYSADEESMKKLPDPGYCEMSQSVAGKAIEAVIKMDRNKLGTFIGDSSPAEREKIMGAFDFRELISKPLKHLKPLFLFPITDKTPAISCHHSVK